MDTAAQSADGTEFGIKDAAPPTLAQQNSGPAAQPLAVPLRELEDSAAKAGGQLTAPQLNKPVRPRGSGWVRKVDYQAISGTWTWPCYEDIPSPCDPMPWERFNLAVLGKGMMAMIENLLSSSE